MYKLIFILLLATNYTNGTAQANNQRYELLSASTTTITPYFISDQAISHRMFLSSEHDQAWLTTMSNRLKDFIPNQTDRNDFLSTVHYEAVRAGLDPQIVLSVIHVESGFKKYAISQAGALGFMQIMPFWVDAIGNEHHNLFHLRVNLRYGCMILRHYLDKENGNYFRALGRYNGSLGQSKYPMLVFNAWRNRWNYSS